MILWFLQGLILIMRKNTRVICGGILSKKIYIFLRWKGVLGIRNKSIENIINLPVEFCRDVSCERIAVNFFVARFLLIVRLERYGWEEGEKGFSSLSPVLIIEDPIYRLFFTGSVLAPPKCIMNCWNTRWIFWCWGTSVLETDTANPNEIVSSFG